MQRKSSSYIAVRLFVALGLLAPAAWAQQDEDAFRLDPLIITATRSAERLSRTTRSVTVISGEDIAAQGTRTVADALRSVPGLDVVRTGALGATTAIFMRGSNSDHTVVLVDGVKINLAGGSIDLADLSVDNIERMEVVRGSASTLYGTGAIGGVIHIITKRGGERLTASLGTEGGSFSTNSQSLAISGGTSWGGLSLSASRTESDGHLPFNNQYDKASVALRADLMPAADTDLSLTLHNSDSEFHFPTNGSGSLCCHNQYNTAHETVLGIRAAHALLPGLDSSLQLGFHERKFRSYPEEAGGFLYVTGEKHLSVDWQSVLHFNLGDLTLGLAHEDDEHTVDGFRRHDTAGYTQLQLKPSESVLLIGGLRAEEHSQFGSVLTYQVSAAYFLLNGTKLRAALGTGFNEPTLIENFSPIFGGNPDLDPERSLTWELGIEHVLLNEQLRLEGVFFSSRFEDLIEYIATPQGQPNFFNVDEAATQGLELSAAFTPLTAWTFGASYTYLLTEDGEGEPLKRRPEHKFHAFGSYSPGRFSGRLDVYYVVARHDRFYPGFPEPPQDVENPAYARVNVALSYKLIEKERYTLELFGRAENLFDEDYEEVYGFETPGIAAFGGIRVRL